MYIVSRVLGLGADQVLVDLAGIIEGCADGFDAAVHHVAGCDDVGAGLGEGDGGAGEQGEGCVVLNLVVGCIFRAAGAVAGDNSAVAVRGVLAEADIGDEDEGVEGAIGFEGAQALLDDAVGCVGTGSEVVLFSGKAEEEQAAEAKRGAGFGLLERLVDGEVEDAGHGGDLFAHALAGAEKERIDERAGVQMRLAHQRAQGWSAAQTAHSCGGKVHT